MIVEMILIERNMDVMGDMNVTVECDEINEIVGEEGVPGGNRLEWKLFCGCLC